MVNCARCGKELDYFESRTVFWNNQLREGYIKASFGMPLKCRERKEFSELKGKKICGICCREIYDEGKPAFKDNEFAQGAISGTIKLANEVNNAILWQKDEVPVGQAECKEIFEDRTSSLGTRVGHGGFLVVTNQRILFTCKLGMLAKEFGVMYGTNLENIVTVSHGRFGLNHKLVILENNNQHRDFVHPNVHSVIPIINSAITERKNQIQAQKEKASVQIILDFSSLKDVMTKGGLIMTTYKCPNCNGMVNIPEAGKVLMCSYCGTPIKPIDIFDKIKSLMQ